MVAVNPVWHLVMQSDALSKGVLVILLGMSIGIWTVFLGKVFVWYRKKRDMHFVLAQIRNVHTLGEITVIASQKVNSLPGLFLVSIMDQVVTLSKEMGYKEGTRTSLKDDLRTIIDQEIDQLVTKEEEYVSVLSTSAVISPLLGLLGTVWGLIHAFVTISQTQVADIATVAPGIAEALITTLAGLIVAIPAVVMVNYVASQIAYLEQQLVCLADQVVRIAYWSMMYKRGDACVDLTVGEQKEVQQ